MVDPCSMGSQGAQLPLCWGNIGSSFDIAINRVIMNQPSKDPTVAGYPSWAMSTQTNSWEQRTICLVISRTEAITVAIIGYSSYHHLKPTSYLDRFDLRIHCTYNNGNQPIHNYYHHIVSLLDFMGYSPSFHGLFAIILIMLYAVL